MARLEIILATVILFILGVVYGQGIARSEAKECLARDVFAGEIKRQFEVTESYVDYVVEDETGCNWLVRAGRWPLYEVGSLVEVRGEAQLVREIPEEYEGYAKYLARKNIAGTVRFGDLTPQHARGRPSPSPRLRRGEHVLGKGRKLLEDNIQKVFREPTGSFVAAVLLAERGMLPEDVQEQFRQTGVAHVLAISGLHISLLAGMLVGILTLLPVSLALRSLLVIVWLWAYIFFIGVPVSAVRAGWFWMLALLFWQRGWLVSLTTVLLLTVTAMVSFDPGLLTDVGFQLSVSAVTGIGLRLFLARRSSPVLQVVLVSLGATLATGPIVAYHFGMISLVNIVANILVVPVVPAVLLLAALALLVNLFWPVAGVGLGLIVHVLFAWMRWVTGWLSSWPGAYFAEVVVPIWVMVVYYALLILGSVFWLKKQGRGWREVWE